MKRLLQLEFLTTVRREGVEMPKWLGEQTAGRRWRSLLRQAGRREYGQPHRVYRRPQ
ncbi:MAG: hypothetical protein OEU50_10570 [Gammaproteobacteria bacterium]|nr:hypothetical protein [Gammaproteobacteria bacterium]